MVFSITKDYFLISHAQKATLHKHFASEAFQYQSLLHIRIYTSENKTHSHQVCKRLKNINQGIRREGERKLHYKAFAGKHDILNTQHIYSTIYLSTIDIKILSIEA